MVWVRVVKVPFVREKQVESMELQGVGESSVRRVVLQYGYVDFINVEATLKEYLPELLQEDRHTRFFFSHENARVNRKAHKLPIRLVLSVYAMLLRNSNVLPDEANFDSSKTDSIGVYLTL